MKCMALPRHKIFIYNLEYAFLGMNHMCTKTDSPLNIYNAGLDATGLKKRKSGESDTPGFQNNTHTHTH